MSTLTESNYGEMGLLVRHAEDLKQRLAIAQSAESTIRAQYELIEFAVRGSSDGLWNWNLNTNDAYLAPQWKKILGYEDHELPNHLDSFSGALHPEDRDRAFAAIQSNIEGGPAYAVEIRLRCKDGTYRWVLTRGDVLRDETGKAMRMAGAISDITERKVAEEMAERTKQQDEVIHVQRAIISELSTPLMPISDHIMVMPLIGAIDSFRAQQILQTLLSGIAQQRTRIVILDITGVPVVDTQVANILIRAAQAAQLLGASVILTGIRSEIAQTMVALGVELRNIVTQSTLQRGISYAFRTIK